MKKFLSAIAVLFVLFAPMHVASAEEVIRNFTVTATLNSERQYTVTENIMYDFGDEERHGIFRNIPVTYLRHNVSYDFHPDVTRVLMDGEDVKFEVSRGGGEMRIKIGDPDVTINGPHTYTITYSTDRAINFFQSGSELYWNVTGNQWPVAIEQATFIVALPEDAANITIPTLCYTGPVGSTEQACVATQTANSVAFTVNRILLPEDGFTVVIGMPPGMIREPSTWEKMLMIVRDNIVLGLPVIALLVMLSIWWQKGRDPKLGTVIPQYEPPEKMTPAELSAMEYDGGVPRRAVIATILDLARRGYLHIKYEEEKKLIGKKMLFTFIKKPAPVELVNSDEQEILSGLFSSGDEVTPEDLAEKHTFYKRVQKADEAVWKRLAEKQLFDGRPSIVRAKCIGLGFVVGIFCFFVFQSYPLGGVMAVMTGIVVVIVGWFMPRRTQKGTKLLADIKGFEWFLSVTEKDRLDFHNAPERSSTQFMEFLPYAVALGIEKKWAAQFEGIAISQPEWAEGSAWSSMNAVAFASQLNTLSTSASSMASPPGSGSSGFSGGSSGGGGGGGGGGSW